MHEIRITARYIKFVNIFEIRIQHLTERMRDRNRDSM